MHLPAQVPAASHSWSGGGADVSGGDSLDWCGGWARRSVSRGAGQDDRGQPGSPVSSSDWGDAGTIVTIIAQMQESFPLHLHSLLLVPRVCCSFKVTKLNFHLRERGSSYKWVSAEGWNSIDLYNRTSQCLNKILEMYLKYFPHGYVFNDPIKPIWGNTVSEIVF